MAKLKRRRSDHGGWSGRGAIWLGVLVATLLVTGVAIHGREPVMDADGSAWLHWQRVATVVHGVFAWVFCVVAERWMWPHVALVWSRRNGNWIWELCLAAAIVGGVAALTGLGLLYGAADWRDALSSVHWWLGLAWPITVLWHVWKWIAAAFSGSGKRWQD